MSQKIKEINEVEYVDMLPNEITKGMTYSINQPNPNRYTHSYFKYPCKFIPEIPRWAMRAYMEDETGLVLDPFSGSGTTLLEAILSGHNAVGTEIDNVAKLLVKVKTTQLSVDEQDFITNWLEDLTNIDDFEEYSNPFVPQINNLDHWFSSENILKLGIIRREINLIENQRIKNFLLITFASIIRKCSNADDVSPKPYVSNRVQKIPHDPFVTFINNTNRYLELMREFSNVETIGMANIIRGDAVNIQEDILADIAITSPPYINAFDYARTLRLENLWLELETEDSLRVKKRDYVGTENIKVKDAIENLDILTESELLSNVYSQIAPLDQKRALIVKKFFEDMKNNLIEVKNKLRVNGRYCIVIGNSKIRKIDVESWKIIAEIAEGVGYDIDSYFSYIIQNPYLRIPRGDKGGIINKDYVLVLKKVEG